MTFVYFSKKEKRIQCHKIKRLTQGWLENGQAAQAQGNFSHW